MRVSAQEMQPSQDDLLIGFVGYWYRWDVYCSYVQRMVYRTVQVTTLIGESPFRL